jgi:hypothetical protein
MMQIKDQVSVLRLIVPVTLACLSLSSHAISQGTPVDRSITATVNRSVTFSAGPLAPSPAVLPARTQSQTTISGSLRTSSSPSGANSNLRSLKTQAGSSEADLPIGTSSSGGPMIGAHPEVREPGALGVIPSLSLGWGSTVRLTSGTKSLEPSPIQMDEAGPVVGGISAPSGGLFAGSRQRRFDFHSSGHSTDIRGGVRSAEAQTGGVRKACKGNMSNCTQKQTKRQPKHTSGWDALQNSK